jgi:hypothetical protein
MSGSPALLMTGDNPLVDAENRRLRQINFTHPARAYLGDDAVMRESSASY